MISCDNSSGCKRCKERSSHLQLQSFYDAHQVSYAHCTSSPRTLFRTPDASSSWTNNIKMRRGKRRVQSFWSVGFAVSELKPTKIITFFSSKMIIISLVIIYREEEKKKTPEWVRKSQSEIIFSSIRKSWWSFPFWIAILPASSSPSFSFSLSPSSWFMWVYGSSRFFFSFLSFRIRI